MRKMLPFILLLLCSCIKYPEYKCTAYSKIDRTVYVMEGGVYVPQQQVKYVCIEESKVPAKNNKN